MLAASCATVVVGLPLAPAATEAAANPSISAHPATDLVDGQFVKLTLAGFAPGTALVFRQCVAGVRIIDTQCTAVNTQVTAIADSAGGGSTYLPVYAGNDVNLANSTGSGSIHCDQRHACVIAGMTDPSTLSGALLVPISFGASPDACPPPGTRQALGSGGAPAFRAIYGWEATVCQPPANLAVGYTLGNSPDGVRSFLTGITSFAVTGPWSPAFAPHSLTNPPRTWAFAPLTVSAVVLAYRIYDLRGSQVTTLTLTPDLIAQIFQGQIPNWSVDSDITNLNPGIEFPPRVVPYARAEHSAETWVFTSWLSAAAPSIWKLGPQEIFPFPPSEVVGATGSNTVGLDVVAPNTDFFGQGNVGFMDSSTAAFYGLPTVNIKRPDGSVTPATPAAIAQALADATVNSDGTVTPDYATSDPQAYPLLMPSLMMVPTNHVDAATGSRIAAFLRYAVQAGQAQLPPGYVALSAALVNRSLEAAKEIPVTPPPSTAPGSPPGLVPQLVVTPPLNLSLPHITLPALATPRHLVQQTLRNGRPTTQRGAGKPAVTLAAPQLALVNDGARFVLPGVAAVAVLGLLAGAALELVSRRRRRHIGTPADADVT